MSRPVLVGVELVQVIDDDGARWVPDLGDLAPLTQPTGPDTYAVQWRTGAAVHAFTFRRVPNQIAGETWWYGSGSANIVGALAANGVPAQRIQVGAGMPPPKRQSFLDAGLVAITRVSDGEFVGFRVPVVFAGENPLAVALDGDVDPDEEYV